MSVVKSALYKLKNTKYHMSDLSDFLLNPAQDPKELFKRINIFTQFIRRTTNISNNSKSSKVSITKES